MKYIQLNAQGRCRPELASMFAWRYKNLQNLPHVFKNEFKSHNAGFVHDMQFINVGDFQVIIIFLSEWLISNHIIQFL